ncbi:BamA/TamA family outer membrane protein [Hydrogenothermus marinus]|uniref:Outer membrane protein insertion porin family n=1 Tax=Hydrogenothermus marinus TaxID=133270 RepID=A0A3M0BDX3_9AQUI|nr:outer membrane protein assembly factor [Hydrogenothermus marinus]RMA93158.1 outer membrane protein insertion porin family [Hydrogenothermus marinus]
MRFFVILLMFFQLSYAVEIYSNFPLPMNNIKEVYNSLKDKTKIKDLLQKTDSFNKITVEKDKIILNRKILVKGISIKGNSSFWDSEIVGVSGLFYGKYISNEDIARIPLKLKQFYVDNGFLDIQIFLNTKINKKGDADIIININEGKRYKIKDVKFFSDIPLSKKEEKKYKEILDLKNKRFSISKIQKSISKLSQYLKDKGYYDSFISIFSFHKINENKIYLYLNIVHGFKYDIKFVGNYNIKEKNLLKLEPFKISGVNYAQIEDFIEKISDYYKSLGFLDVSIDFSYKEELKTSLAYIYIYIYEGKRYRIKDISFNSDFKLPKDILKQIRRFKGRYFQKKLLSEPLEKLIFNLRKKGYANSYYQISYIKEGKNLILNITIYRGKKYLIKEALYKGYNPKTKLKTPIIYSGALLVNYIDSIKKELFEKGYLDAKVDMQVELKESKNIYFVKPIFNIKTGKRYKLSKAFIYGTWHLKPKVLRWNIKEDDYYEKYRFDNELNFLYKSYLFSFINPDLEVDKKNKSLNKILVLTEDKRGLVQGLIGYNSVEKLKAAVSLTLKNLFGYGLETTGYIDISSLNTNYKLDLGSRLLPKYSSLFVSAYRSNQFHKYYDLLKKGFDITYNKRPNKWATQQVKLDYSVNKISNSNIYIKNPYNKYDISFSLKYDNRNNKIYPTSGFYFSSTFGKTFSDVEYFYGNFMLRYYYKFLFFVFTQRISSGGKFIGIEKLPISERYFLGGISTIRGFGYEELSNNGIGGNSFAYINNDLRFPIFKGFNLYGFLFYDLGNIYPNKKEFLKFKTRETAGIGIFVPTPAGAFSFDYAKILDKKEGEQSYRFEFSINIIF